MKHKIFYSLVLIFLVCITNNVSAQFVPFQSGHFKRLAADTLYNLTDCGAPSVTPNSYRRVVWYYDSCNQVNYYWQPENQVWATITGGGGGDTTLIWERTLNNQGAIPFDFSHTTDMGYNAFALDHLNFFGINANDPVDARTANIFAGLGGAGMSGADENAAAILSLAPTNNQWYTIALGDTPYLSRITIDENYFKFDKEPQSGLSFPAGVAINPKIVYKSDTLLTPPEFVYVSDNDTIKKYLFAGSGSDIRDTSAALQGFGIYINNIQGRYQPNLPSVSIEADTAGLRNYFNQFYNNYQIDTSQVDFIVYEIDATPNFSLPDGTKVLVAHSGTTGDFVGHEDDIATLVGGVYTFQDASSGDQLLVSTTQAAYQFSSALWNRISYAWLGGGNLLGIPLSGGTRDAHQVTLKTKDVTALTIDTLQNVAVNKFIGTRSGNYAMYDSTTGNFDTGFFRPLIPISPIYITPGPTGDSIGTMGGDGGGIDSITKAPASDTVFQYTSGVGTKSFITLKLFNVKDYGAYGDSVHSDVAAIHRAMDAANAAGGGIVYFPRPSVYYKIDTALIGSCNCQIKIPSPAAIKNRSTIVLLGEIPPNDIPVGGNLPFFETTIAQGGVRLKSTITSGATGAAIIGSDANNHNNIVIQNLALEVKNNPGTGPVIGGVALPSNIGNIYIDHVAAYVDTAGNRSSLPSVDVSGFETPNTALEDNYVIKNSRAIGFRNGVYISEHVSLDHLVVWGCWNGIKTKLGAHASYGSRVLLQWCKNDIYFGGALTLNISQLDDEFIASDFSGGKWYDNAYTVNDSLNVGRGIFYYQTARAGAGPEEHFIKNGATGISTYFLYNGNANYTGRATFGLPSGHTPVVLNVAASTNNNLRWDVNGVDKFYAGVDGTDFRYRLLTASGLSEPFTVLQNGNVGIGATNPSYPLEVHTTQPVTAYFQNTSTTSQTTFYVENNRGGFSAYGGMLIGGATNAGSNLFGVARADNLFMFADGLSKFTVGTLGSQPFAIGTNNSTRVVVSSAGAVQFNTYGAGTATFDASGNITSVSDERVKKNIKSYRTGLRELMNISPITYKYNGLSGNETNGTYVGFSAQNVKDNIPYSTGVTADGYLTLQDRAILATLVNAVKEQQKEIEELKAEIKRLK